MKFTVHVPGYAVLIHTQSLADAMSHANAAVKTPGSMVWIEDDDIAGTCAVELRRSRNGRLTITDKTPWLRASFRSTPWFERAKELIETHGSDQPDQDQEAACPS